MERILDAAAALLAELGYDRLALSAVAERSGSSVGSLYHFFSSKEQLVDALAERLAASVAVLPGSILTESFAALPIPQLVHLLVTPLATFASLHPELPELMGRVTERVRAVDADIEERLATIFRARRPALSRLELQRVVQMTMEVVRAGVRMIARSTKRKRGALAAELEAVLTSYLRERLE